MTVDFLDAADPSGAGSFFSAPADDGGGQPVIRTRDEHGVSRRDIDPDALRVLYRLASNGYTAYLVGGGVRDLLLGRKPKDFDVSTNARPEQIRALFKNCILIGRRFRLAHIRYGEKIIETSTFRSSPAHSADPLDPEADLFQRDDNLFGTPREDALRRDFTVNGLFYDINTFSVIDYVGGMEDLAERRIRAIGDSGIRFREDPVRMIRAIRFASRLDFSIAPGTAEALRRHGQELAKASPARLLEEIFRLFAFSSGEKAVRLLGSTGLLQVILPEVAASLEGERDGSGRRTLWDRLEFLDRGDTVMPEATPALIFSALLLDPLKQYLRRDWDDDNFPRLRFEKIHSFLQPLAQRLRFPRKLVDRIVHIYLSQSRLASPDAKPGSLAGFVTQESFHEALALAEILAGDGAAQEKLNIWRDMLAERVYLRENGANQSGRGIFPIRIAEAAADMPAADPSAAAASADLGGGSDGERHGRKKLSRSARRRRNKRMRRLPGDGNVLASAAAADGNAAPGIDAGGGEGEGLAPALAAEAVPASGGDARPGNVSAASMEDEKPRRAPRGSRGGSRRARQAKEGTASRSADATPEEKPEAAAFRPLTAASFYGSAPPAGEPPAREAAKAKTSGRSGRRGGKKKPEPAGDGPADGAGNQEAALPLRPDLADEANTPDNWMDEI
ncbi:MAG: polynucleotide adenylyltransferase PcnB [Planctomycetota bacterium]|jgi:poly(A) polymerase|nr:polynucleotide adenylyltransferase PcnB [Planctomycetota bacterium]